MNIQSLAADIARRIPDMIHDSPVNNADLIAGLIANEIGVTRKLVTDRTISFSVDGEPKAQPRPKAFARNFGNKRQARVYDPGTAEGWKSLIAIAVKPHLPAQPITGPVSLFLIFHMPRPKSHFNSHGALKPNAPVFHVSKPDADNLAKAVCDALTQCGLWRDDSQVAQMVTTKTYTSDKPGLDVCVVMEGKHERKRSTSSTIQHPAR